ncbi:MAG: tetratricopeptide repeat protein [Chitinophagaceae bacterium]|nr:MAG: tetratricopeptide repeat protein [Chitinophagaceae bacterium]
MKKKKDGFDKDLTRFPGDAGNPMAPLLEALGIRAGGAGGLQQPADAANELVYEALELEDDEEAFTLVQSALLLDPGCILAYEYLAECEIMPTLSIPHYAWGVQLGRRLFGGKYLKENKGQFWGLVETRPFMRCLYGYGRNCYYLGRREESISCYQELIELNPTDNQGVRYELGAHLLEAGDSEGYAQLRGRYPHERGALFAWSDALHAFRAGGESPAADELLKAAVAANPHVAKHLLAKDLPEDLPDSYKLGSNDEALYYASFAWVAWQGTPGATGWLRKRKPAAKAKKKGGE